MKIELCFRCSCTQAYITRISVANKLTKVVLAQFWGETQTFMYIFILNLIYSVIFSPSFSNKKEQNQYLNIELRTPPSSWMESLWMYSNGCAIKSQALICFVTMDLWGWIVLSPMYWRRRIVFICWKVICYRWHYFVIFIINSTSDMVSPHYKILKRIWNKRAVGWYMNLYWHLITKDLIWIWHILKFPRECSLYELSCNYNLCSSHLH